MLEFSSTNASTVKLKDQLLEVQEEKSSLGSTALVGLVTRRPKISRFESLNEQHFTSLLGHEPHVKLQFWVGRLFGDSAFWRQAVDIRKCAIVRPNLIFFHFFFSTLA